ncbi:uncharacterized protein [Nicotiana tomentosiformis]|uniref:uncharacterized protein n=1 Tax=Nicotiana tomentosiformis TaxID=4098 RepID=UPI00388CAA6C
MANLDIDNPRHPLYLQPSDNPGNVIISIQLKGTESYSVSSELVTRIMYASDAHEGWLDLQDRFDKVNGSRICNLQGEIATISQEISSNSWSSRKFFQFLMGLNESYNAIRSQILLQSPSPSISRAYAM